MSSKGEDAYLKNKALYEEAVKQYVCEHCEDIGEDGECNTKDPEGCGVFRNLPELVRIAHSLNERSLEPYIRAVREHVCSQCKNSTQEGGNCELRNNLDCGLDRYLPLVIAAIEEVDRKLGKV